jgi:hypothetical protein
MNRYTLKNTNKQITEDNAREILIKMFLRKWKKIGRTILEVALGKVKVRRTDGTYYAKSPDAKLLQWIVDTVLTGQMKNQGQTNAPELLKQMNDALQKMVEEMKKQPRIAGDELDEEAKKLLTQVTAN